MVGLNGTILGAHVTRSAPRTTHLLFANDNLIFEEALVRVPLNVLNVLRLYTGSSSQIINFANSSVFFSANVNARTCGEVGNVF